MLKYFLIFLFSLSTISVFADPLNSTEIIIENTFEKQIDVLQNEMSTIRDEILTIQKNQLPVEGINDGIPINVKILQELIPKTALDWVLLISGIFSVALVMFVGIQTMTTRKEVKERLRPWIRIMDPKYSLQGFIIFKNKKSISWAEYWKDRQSMDTSEIDVITLNMLAINGGFNPSTKAILIATNSKTKIGKIDLRDNHQLEKTNPIMPNEELAWSHSIPPQLYVDSFKQPFYLGAECTYVVGNKLYRIGKIWEMQGTVHSTIDYWFDEEQTSRFPW